MIKRVSVPFFHQPHQSAVGFEASSSNCLEPHCQASGSGLHSSSPTLLWKCVFLPTSHRWSLWFSASLFQQKLAPLIDTAVHRPLSVSLPSWTSLECRERSSAIKWSFQILVYQLESRKGWFLLLSSLVEFGFSKWASRVCVSLSRVRLFATPWTVAHQAPLSMGFPRSENWSGLPFPSPGGLPKPGIEPRSPALQADSLLSEPSEKLPRGREEGAGN